jgi:hypothetical protein
MLHQTLRAHRTLGSFVLLLCATPLWAQETPALSAATFDELRARILPGSDELTWREIPWRAALWEGVLEAQAAEKPLLLWAMNGHPLGCT